MAETIEVRNWTNYFKDFSAKNLKRPVKLEIFGAPGALQEVKRMPLAGVYIELTGTNAPRAEILLGGLSARAADNLTHTVRNVKSILTLKGGDQFESAIEFESADGTKTLLSFESTTAETQTA
ncbi:MAG: DUF5335 family protein [Acidobacteria bacterium]|nr:DUF5335 family protein [Acidobacteriota bacterium]